MCPSIWEMANTPAPLAVSKASLLPGIPPLFHDLQSSPRYNSIGTLPKLLHLQTLLSLLPPTTNVHMAGLIPPIAHGARGVSLFTLKDFDTKLS